jgi:hypothetical protein
MPLHRGCELLDRPAGDTTLEDLVWAYERPLPEAPWLEGFAGFYTKKMGRALRGGRARVRRPARPLPPGRRLESSRTVTISVDGRPARDERARKARVRDGPSASRVRAGHGSGARIARAVGHPVDHARTRRGDLLASAASGGGASRTRRGAMRRRCRKRSGPGSRVLRRAPSSRDQLNGLVAVLRGHRRLGPTARRGLPALLLRAGGDRCCSTAGRGRSASCSAPSACPSCTPSFSRTTTRITGWGCPACSRRSTYGGARRR